MAEKDRKLEPVDLDLGKVLTALADPYRRRVIRELARAGMGTERTCASFQLPVSKATVTHHFRVLREAGLIRQVDRGNSRTTALRREEIDTRFPGLLPLIAEETSP
ncbi:ArsR/SmtB family transcription factor [Roseibium alexandrii]|uniref:Putative transcriptional regulator n=1 Tax=Roseibium alexandrii (strain DSM 17067 / NCIMB 14079 / DFL-11) TaxID=244592 RepID=A0A5E8H2T9_ROSAD|nr:helix-turn-helix domain-containing protein [Roseibium alexandrii]EEE46851.2 putative transcriptional regulator [Roseibium alexandrii DFL-11]